MKFVKFLAVLIVVAIIGVFAYVGVQVLNARRDVSSAASAAASAAAQAISTPTTRDNAKAIAEKTAKANGDVLTSFAYDPVAARVSLTVSGKAKSLVLHYLDKNLTDNIKSSASARPG